MVLGIHPFADRTDDDRPRLDSEEEVMRVESDAAVALGRRPPESLGTLYVTTKYDIYTSKPKSRGYRSFWL
jgi:chloride channel, nucleotide-sensitive, 1A